MKLYYYNMIKVLWTFFFELYHTLSVIVKKHQGTIFFFQNDIQQTIKTLKMVLPNFGFIKKPPSGQLSVVQHHGYSSLAPPFVPPPACLPPSLPYSVTHSLVPSLRDLPPSIPLSSPPFFIPLFPNSSCDIS